MPTPPKDNSTQTNATSSNSSANAANASPAPSSSSGYPVPPNLSNFKRVAQMPEGFHDGKRYAPTPDGQPPNGGLVPGVYLYKDQLLVGVREPPLATSTGGTQADQNAHRDAGGESRSDGK